MFTFESLEIYKLSFEFSKKVFYFTNCHSSIDEFLKKQLKRATLSINLNIAEGSGRFSMPDRRHFYVISRGSTLEAASILKLIQSLYIPEDKQISVLLNFADEISRALFSMIKQINPSRKINLL